MAGITQTAKRLPIILQPEEGRHYSMGPMRAVFKADGEETNQAYSVSEWWLEAHTQGPGAHTHDEDDLFYVLQGVMTFLVEDEWIEAAQGSFILIPGGVQHDFQNRSDSPAGVLNFSAPGNFESHMPAICDWFVRHPLQKA